MADWYVVSTATGAANGTSESDAWTTLAAITGVSANDRIYVKATAEYDTQDGATGAVWDIDVAGSTGSR